MKKLKKEHQEKSGLELARLCASSALDAKAEDLVILDVLMPKESGVRLYRDLKTDKAFCKIPVIMLSGIARKSFAIFSIHLAKIRSFRLPGSSSQVKAFSPW